MPLPLNNLGGLMTRERNALQSTDFSFSRLPNTWNRLVGYDVLQAGMSNVHFTIGGPYFEEYRDCEYAAEWFAEREAMLRVEQRR